MNKIKNILVFAFFFSILMGIGLSLGQTIVLNSPTDGATGVVTDPMLSVNVTDSTNDSMNVTFQDASDNSTICHNTSIANGSTVTCTWSNLNYNTTYDWFVNATDGTNTTESSHWNFTTEVNVAPFYSNFTVNNPGTYHPTTNTTISIDWADDNNNFDTSTLEHNFNGTPQNITGTTNYSSVLAAGTYYVKFYGNDSEGLTNQTTKQNFTINKSAPALALTANNVTYPTDLEISATEDNNGGADLTYKLYIDGVFDTQNDSNIHVFRDLAAGNYTVTYNTTGGQNYTQGSVSKTAEVKKGITNIDIIFSGNGTSVINGNYSIPKGWQLNVTAVTNVLSGQVNTTLFKLWRDGTTEVGNISGSKIEYLNSTLSPGTYYFNSTYFGNQNYTDFTRDPTVTVYNNPPQISLNSPLDTATEVPLDAVLNVTVTDNNGDSMNVTFYNAFNDQELCNSSNVANGSDVTCTWWSREPGTTYNWYVTVSDGTNTTQSSTWTFTTTYNVSRCTSIINPGTYNITLNITHNDTCIIIDSNNVVLDGKGHLLNYSGTNFTRKMGVMAENVNNITVKDIVIKKFEAGIRLANVTNSTITKVSLNLNENQSYHGLSIELGSEGNTLKDSLMPDFKSINQSNGNIVKNVTFSNTTVSFTYKGDISVNKDNGLALPSNKVGIGRYIGVQNQSTNYSWVHLNMSYTDSDISGINESTLEIWKHNGSNWTQDNIISIGVNNTENVVYGNITGFSTFTAMGSDSGAPNITLNSPADTSYLPYDNVPLNFTAIDNLNDWVHCNVTIDGSNYPDEVNWTVLYVPANGSSWTYWQSNMSEGTHDWNVTCWDDAGNTNTSETRNFTVDTTYPIINITHPLQGDEVNNADGNVTMNFTVNELNVKDIVGTIDQRYYCNTSNSNISNSSGSFHCNFTGLEPGSHTALVTVNDSAGHFVMYHQDFTVIGATLNVSDVVNTLDSVLSGSSGVNSASTAIFRNGADVSTNDSVDVNTSFSIRLTLNLSTTNTNVTVEITEFNGLDAFWNQNFSAEADLGSPFAGYIENATGDNIVNMLYLMGTSNFLPNFDFLNGARITFHDVNMSGLDAVYLEDNSTSDAYELLQCSGNNPMNVTSISDICYTNTSQNVTLYVPHLSGGGLTNDTTAPVISNVGVGSISTSGATITWDTDEYADSKVEYGTDATSLGNTETSSTEVKSHSISLSSLSSDTTYYYNVTSCDDDGNCNTTGTYSFTTDSVTSIIGGGSTSGSDSEEEYDTSEGTVNDTREDLSNETKEEIEEVVGSELTEEEWETVIEDSTEIRLNRSITRTMEFTNSMKSTLTIGIDEEIDQLFIVDEVVKKFDDNASDITLSINPTPENFKWIEEDPVLVVYYDSVDRDITITYETDETYSYLKAKDFPEPQIYTLASVTCLKVGCPGEEICRQVDGEYTCVVNEEPKAVFSVSKEEAQLNEKVEFNASESSDSDGTIESYEWSFGDGETATGEITSHKYTETGNYTVTLTVTDNDGAEATYTETVKVMKSPATITEAGSTVVLGIALVAVIALAAFTIWYYTQGKGEGEFPLGGK